MPLSVFTIELVARILVIAIDSGMIARKTGRPFVQFISREISQATSSLTFSTRNSILETRSSRLETRYSKLSRIEYRVSRLEGLSTYFWAVLYLTTESFILCSQIHHSDTIYYKPRVVIRRVSMRMPTWSISLWSISMVMRRIAVSNVLSVCTMLSRQETIALSLDTTTTSWFWH